MTDENQRQASVLNVLFFCRLWISFHVFSSHTNTFAMKWIAKRKEWIWWKRGTFVYTLIKAAKCWVEENESDSHDMQTVCISTANICHLAFHAIAFLSLLASVPSSSLVFVCSHCHTSNGGKCFTVHSDDGSDNDDDYCDASRMVDVSAKTESIIVCDERMCQTCRSFFHCATRSWHRHMWTKLDENEKEKYKRKENKKESKKKWCEDRVPQR